MHEAAWSPRNDEFIVVYGFMPAKATIFSSDRCEPRYQLGADLITRFDGTHLAVLSALLGSATFLETWFSLTGKLMENTK